MIDKTTPILIKVMRTICLSCENWSIIFTYDLNAGPDCIIRSTSRSSKSVNTGSSSEDSSESSNSMDASDSCGCESIASKAFSGLSDQL